MCANESILLQKKGGGAYPLEHKQGISAGHGFKPLAKILLHHDMSVDQNEVEHGSIWMITINRVAILVANQEVPHLDINP